MKKDRFTYAITFFSFIGAIVTLLLASCTDATMSKVGGLGDEFKVELLDCNGNIVRSWTSTGKVISEEKSDGYYFKDKESGKLIEVTGTLIITKK
jgi:hypothetical protein